MSTNLLINLPNLMLGTVLERHDDCLGGRVQLRSYCAECKLLCEERLGDCRLEYWS